MEASTAWLPGEFSGTDVFEMSDKVKYKKRTTSSTEVKGRRANLWIFSASKHSAPASTENKKQSYITTCLIRHRLGLDNSTGLYSVLDYRGTSNTVLSSLSEKNSRAEFIPVNMCIIRNYKLNKNHRTRWQSALLGFHCF